MLHCLAQRHEGPRATVWSRWLSEKGLVPRTSACGRKMFSARLVITHFGSSDFGFPPFIGLLPHMQKLDDMDKSAWQRIEGQEGAWVQVCGYLLRLSVDSFVFVFVFAS